MHLPMRCDIFNSSRLADFCQTRPQSGGLFFQRPPATGSRCNAILLAQCASVFCRQADAV